MRIALSRRRNALITFAIAVTLGLSGCKGQDNKPGQAIARVNGDEITVHQLNGELAQVSAENPEAVRKQVTDALIERQLLIGEAIRTKLDRDSNVMQAIERAKAQILAQAYLQSKLSSAANPSNAEIDSYYQQHPELFAQRKLFDMRQLTVASKDFTDQLKAVVDAAKSLDEVAGWLESHKVDYVKGQLSRTTADLPSQLVEKLDVLSKGQPFIMKDAARYVIASLNYVKDSPVSQEAAKAPIEQYLRNKKTQEVAVAEVSRLRASAKIEYLDKSVEPPPAPAKAAASKNAEAKADDHIERGVAGLK